LDRVAIMGKGYRAGRMVMLCASEKAGIKKMYN